MMQDLIPQISFLLNHNHFHLACGNLDEHGDSLEQIAKATSSRDQTIADAAQTGVYTLTEILRHFGIHQCTASRIARRERDA